MDFIKYEQAEECVYEAIKDGYRLIDTAQYYGDEVGVGKGVRKAIQDAFPAEFDILVNNYGLQDKLN